MRHLIQRNARSYAPGDIIATPSDKPLTRREDGGLDNVETLEIVLYDEEMDEMVLEPISFRLAKLLAPEPLYWELRRVRPEEFAPVGVQQFFDAVIGRGTGG